MDYTRSITFVVGLDAVTFRQWCVSLPSWLHRHPWMAEARWLVFYDGSQLRPSYIESAAGLCGIRRLRLVHWPSSPIVHEWETQREKMLTGHLFVPAMHCQTTWACKIDTDAVCLEKKDWPAPEWFVGKHEVVASPWSYTKAKGGGGDIRAWCRELETAGDMIWPDTRRLDLHRYISGDKIRMQRWASWLCFQRVSWLAYVADALEEHYGVQRMPVPSHDTTLWYIGARTGHAWLPAKQKRYGWTNIPSAAKLRAVVQEMRDRSWSTS